MQPASLSLHWLSIGGRYAALVVIAALLSIGGRYAVPRATSLDRLSKYNFTQHRGHKRASRMTDKTPDTKLHLALLISFLALLVWSVIKPHDLFTWFLETVPAMIALVILIATYRRFRLSNLAYVLIWIHAIILLVGGHYTYAEVPLFNWIRDTFHLSRNHYDRVGHFAQGFVPAIIAREVLLRKSPLKRGRLLTLIVISICLAISAMYELVEFEVSMATGSAGDAFLGTQGDVWDTQRDMLMCLIGAATALVSLSGLHDRSLRRLVECDENTLHNGSTEPRDS